MKSSRTKLLQIVTLLVVSISHCPVSGSSSCQLLVKEREAYIERTADWPALQRDLSWKRSQEHLPSLFRGLELAELQWTSSVGSQEKGLRIYRGIGQTYLGEVEILVHTKAHYSLTMVLRPHRSVAAFLDSLVNLWREIYPALKISERPLPTDQKTQAYQRQQETVLQLKRSQVPTSSSFVEMSRSLVNIIVNDPDQIGDLNPRPESRAFALPRELRAIRLLAANLSFLEGFGKFREVLPQIWFADYVSNARFLSLTTMGVQVNVKKKHLNIWLQGAEREDVLSHLRRSLWVFLEFLPGPGEWPEASISSLTGVHIGPTALKQASLDLVAEVRDSINSPVFSRPLQGLRPLQVKWIHQWVAQSLDQSELNHPIRAHEIYQDHLEREE